MEKLKRTAVYIRVSSEEQAERGDSIRDQTERCTAYINSHKDMILQDTYIDDGISGQKLDREDFNRLIKNVRNGEVDLIIFTKLDRWFRSLRHYLNTQAVLERANVGWLAVDQPYFDTSTPYGRAFVAQSMTWAELEAQNGGIRVRDVFKTKVAHGEVITGKVPRGYKIDGKRLVLSEEAPAIFDTIDYFCKTQSLGKTLRYLKNTHGIIMTLNNLRESVLRNEKLVGRYRGNHDYCPRLITDEMWNQVQGILDSNSNIRTSQRYPYIFSGLLVCEQCGHKMTSCHINVKSRKANGKEYRYRYPAYECKQYRAHHCTNGRQVREIRIEEYLLKHIEEELNAYCADFNTQQKAAIDQSGKRKAIEKKLERLKDLYINEVIELDEYKKDRFSLEEQLAAIPQIPEVKSERPDISKLLSSDFKLVYENMSNEEKRRFWRSIIREIRVPGKDRSCQGYSIVFL